MTVAPSRRTHGHSASLAPLWRLARECGVQPSYTNIRDQRVRSTPEVIMAALRAFGVPIDSPDRAADLHHGRVEARRRCVLDPVIVVWADRAHGRVRLVLRLPRAQAESVIQCTWTCEDGHEMRWTTDMSQVHAVGSESTEVVLKPIDCQLSSDHAIGYHRVEVEIGGERHGAWVFVAPQRAYQMQRRTFGVFLPCYAIRSDRNWGMGDFSDLCNVASWLSENGGRVVATLPLVASHVEAEPLHASPYAPTSRLYWNELFLDVEAAPEYSACREAQALVESAEYQDVFVRLRAAEYVDYPRVFRLKRRVLGMLATAFFRSSRRSELERELERNPDLETYARFRAATEEHGSWRTWPASEREAPQSEAEFIDKRARHYHLYAQLLCREQLSRIAQVEGDRVDLYLDLPVGTHPDGYDTWRFRDAFVEGASAGAPPDDFFVHGQNWGFPPLHPERTREDGHMYFRRCIQEHLRFAAGLRIDHVMWMHRLYWVPDGCASDEGVYVRYPAEEIYAILCIESNRAESWIVGENLGTVPPRVDRMMDRRGIAPLYVAQFSWTGDAQRPLRKPPKGAVASLNTHDTPTFAAFWTGSDIEDRLNLGILSEADALHEREARKRIRASVIEFLRSRRVQLGGHGMSEHDIAVIAQALLVEMASGGAGVVLASLEDFWAETRPHNVPGTVDDKHWRRKAARTFDDVQTDADIRKCLLRLKEVMG